MTNIFSSQNCGYPHFVAVKPGKLTGHFYKWEIDFARNLLESSVDARSLQLDE
jgi:hypothetical protein